MGPAFGFIVGSLCTRVYADLSVVSEIDSSNPRWIGAWWLGLVIISGLLVLASIAMFAFPKRLPHVKPLHRPKTNIAITDKKQHPSLRGNKLSCLDELGLYVIFFRFSKDC